MNNYVDSPFESPTVLSLCPGLLRGLERGIESALGTTLRVASFVEIEAVILENLLAGMEAGVVDAAPIWANLKTFPFGKFHGKIHGFIGGYPCQPFSVAGKRKGKEDPRHLWPYIADGIRAAQPIWCFFENVVGHLTLGYEEVKEELESMGYIVKEGIYSAEEVGAPHRRERLFILAIKVGYTEIFNWGLPISTRGSFQKDIESIRSSESMGNTSSNNKWRPWQIKRKNRFPIGRSGYELAYSTSNGFWRINKRGLFSQIIRGGSIMAHTYHQRSQGRHSGELQKCGRECTARTSSAFKRFPAPPQHEQYEWEEPRTIEPGMDLTIDGYRFREDLLRGAGNGVVWQTAELAFMDLLRKHGIELCQ